MDKERIESNGVGYVRELRHVETREMDGKGAGTEYRFEQVDEVR